MAKTEDALRAEVPRVCRVYCAQVWDEALNQAGVEPSSMLRKEENIYYPPAIRALSSSSSKTDTPLEVADSEKQNPHEVPPPPSSPPKLAKQPKASEKEVEMNKEVAFDTNMPPVVPQDPSKDKEDTKMEIVLASLPIPTKGDSQGVDQWSSEVAT